MGAANCDDESNRTVKAPRRATDAHVIAEGGTEFDELAVDEQDDEDVDMSSHGEFKVVQRRKRLLKGVTES